MDLTSAADTFQSPVIALDLGAKRVGVAISDKLAIAITRLEVVPRSNWKQLLRDVAALVRHYDAQTVVIGLPLNLNGSDGDAAIEARRLAMNFARSLSIPVYLQDERLTSVAAEQNLRLHGYKSEEISAHVDSEAAAVILGDFLGSNQPRTKITSDTSLTIPEP